jgi:glycerophosphoryl diester phosphodiesterase
MPSPFDRRPLLFGHRGAKGTHPENTLPAFAAAVAGGANALELDVQVAKTGEVVVIHDLDGTRLALQPAQVKDTPWDTLRCWDVGHAFVEADGSKPFVGRGLAPPLLSDVLRAFPGLPINVDLKDPDPAAAAAVVELVRAVDDPQRVLLTSFFDPVIQAVRRAGHRGPTGLARNESLALRLLPARFVGRQAGQRIQIPPRHGPLRQDTAGFIHKAHKAGLAVDFWVVNDVEEGRRLLDLGADGLITDFPARLAPLWVGRTRG